jgi:hypothetical protein
MNRARKLVVAGVSRPGQRLEVLPDVLAGQRAADRPRAVRAPWGAPLQGPIEEQPLVSGELEVVEMLAQATAGLPMGVADQALLEWAKETWELADIAVLASLFARARQHGGAR